MAPDTRTTGPGDLRFVQQLMTELFQLQGELARHVMRTRALDAEFEERVTAIYGGDHLRVARGDFAKDAAIGFAGYAGGDPTATVVRVIDASADCLVVEADVDPRPMYTTAVSLRRGDVHQLHPASIERFNPTGWGIVAMGRPLPHSPLEVCT